ncbi:MAG: ImmA/IrrE family metallo-endopeptidase [Eubacteriales bacterium]|nr:ImmA/IrrE family metallo-endopeptidase [Eubacteriales bacterium]
MVTDLYFSKPAIEMIAARELKKYKNGILINGEPCAIPIEEMLEIQYGLTIEYHYLRKNGNVLGQAVFENCYVPIYDMNKNEYTTIEVDENTLVIDCRLLAPKYTKRLRFTIFHEFAHWLLHQEMFKNTGLSLPYVKNHSGISDPIERQADMLCAALLMPKGQLKKAYYRFSGRGDMVEQLSELFQASKQAVEIRLHEFNLI